MFCSECGSANSDKAKFCYQCGASIMFPAPQSVVPIPTENKSKDNSTRKISYPILITLLVVIGAVGVFGVISLSIFYFENKRANERTAQNFNKANTQTFSTNQAAQTPIPYNPETTKVQRAAQDAANAMAEAANRAAQDYRNFNAARNTRISSGTCEVLETSNLKQNCDSANCDDDPNTVVIKITQGSTVQMTNYSNIPSRFGYSWTPVQVNASGIEDGLYYIASKKLRCF